jgi:hypothetical protein
MAVGVAWENLQQQLPAFPEFLLRGTRGLGSEQAPVGVFGNLTFRDRLAFPAGRDREMRRAREIRWREAHSEVLRQYAGQWVALEGERIVAHGPDAARVAVEARNLGVAIPYIFRVEEASEDVVLMGL